VSAAGAGGVRPLRLHPDRLLPTGAEERSVAREILAAMSALPLVSPHGHLDARLFLDDAPFADPSQLLVTSDHYVVRLLHSQGVALSDLGVARVDGQVDHGVGGRPDGRAIWHHLCRHWGALAGTPSRLWLEHELHELFGVREVPSPGTADSTYDTVARALATDALRPRALYRRFGLEVLTTTDSPLDDLAVHDALAADASWTGRILPTFRPDEVVDPAPASFAAKVARLGEVAGIDTSSYAGYVAALESRREAFAARGATATDHGVPVRSTERLGASAVEAVFSRLLAGTATPAEQEAFRGHMLDEMARMACDDGLVMQLHVGVVRDYDPATHARYGSDVGQDFSVATEYTTTLRPLLSRYGDSAALTLVLYTVDETVYSREIGPLVSYFPALRAGAPWWFLDAPDAMGRAFDALGETAGIANMAGFVDDTRSLCGIGARHDVARRAAAGYLARLVCEHRLEIEEAAELGRGFAYDRPKAIFKV
jgi:glucuronate isomerase